MKTHKVLDFTYSEDEDQGVLVGTEQECNDFVSEQDTIGLEIFPMTRKEIEEYPDNIEEKLALKILPTGFPTLQRAVFNGKYLEHFGIHASLASMYGHNADEIVEVEMTVHENQTKPPTGDNNDMTNDYWGWFDYENDRNSFSLIYAKRFLLEMCFPNMRCSEERGQGKAYRLKLVGNLYK
jgi:hypothetical protein